MGFPKDGNINYLNEQRRPMGWWVDFRDHTVGAWRNRERKVVLGTRQTSIEHIGHGLYRTF